MFLGVLLGAAQLAFQDNPAYTDPARLNHIMEASLVLSGVVLVPAIVIGFAGLTRVDRSTP